MPLQNTWYINNTKYVFVCVCARCQPIFDCQMLLFTFFSLSPFLVEFPFSLRVCETVPDVKEKTTTTKYDAKRIVFVDKICCWRAISISIRCFSTRENRKTFFRISFVIFVFLLLFFSASNTFYISSFLVHIPIFFYSLPVL